jgi:hypothetical protein
MLLSWDSVPVVPGLWTVDHPFSCRKVVVVCMPRSHRWHRTVAVPLCHYYMQATTHSHRPCRCQWAPAVIPQRHMPNLCRPRRGQIRFIPPHTCLLATPGYSAPPPSGGNSPGRITLRRRSHPVHCSASAPPRWHWDCGRALGTQSTPVLVLGTRNYYSELGIRNQG